MSTILQPEIVVIGTRRYRRNANQIIWQDRPYRDEHQPYEEETEDMYRDEADPNENAYTRKPQNKATAQVYDEYEDEIACKMEHVPKPKKEDDEEYKDIFQDNGVYKLKMAVSEAYYGFIIGRQGEKKNSLERETQTTIKIPSRNNKGNELVTIEGKSKANVASCRNRLILLISSARHLRSFTHLLTFPINFTPFKAKFATFRELVLKNCGSDRGVDESIFMVPNKFHLTICTLTLLDKNEVEQAKDVLDQCWHTFISELVTKAKPLRVSVQGLEYMNDDPSDVDVLYAKINAVNGANIQQVADKLMERFVEIGLAQKQYDRVKIHATVMNTLRRQEQSAGSRAETTDEFSTTNQKTRESFDARNILKKYGDYDFGEFTLADVQLSLRFSTAPDGYYECVHKLKL